MPYLNPSFILLDPMIASRIKVLRYSEVVNAYGRSVETPPEEFYPVIGVLTMAGPNDLERLDDSQRMGRVISFVTKFGLRGPSSGGQPDRIVWEGNEYLVHSLDPYPQYGSGFVQALAGSMDIMDTPVRTEP